MFHKGHKDCIEEAITKGVDMAYDLGYLPTGVPSVKEISELKKPRSRSDKLKRKRQKQARRRNR